ncbi:fimbrial protein [Proteus faecis]|uniref:fimbrial protein n=1 Tax=Proteus faecis TaxID=2050967 RepID=UPI0020C0F04C
MNKKSLLYCVFFIILTYEISFAYSSNTIDIEFDGQLVTTGCQVSADSLNKKIKLDNLRWQNINENGVSQITSFSIAIEKCNEADLQKTVSLTWQSNQLVDIDKDSYLKTKGNSNILLGITDKEGKLVSWNKSMSLGEVTIIGDSQQFDFGVFVRKPKSENAKVGDFTGTATFMLEYE